MFRTDDHAGGFESHIQTMSAEGAFRGGVCLGVEIDRIIRTGLHTGFAADANAGVKLNDAIITLIHGRDGTDAHARRVDAMIAARHLKVAAHIGVCARFNIFDPCAIYANRHLILRLARGGTGVTADTFGLVDEKAVVLSH